MLASVLASVVAVVLYVTLWWLVSLRVRRLDVADIAWGFGIALVAFVSFALAATHDVRLHLLVALVFLWSTRLTLHIFKRNARKSEDARYVALARSWGARAPLASFLKVFLLQGVLMVLVGYVFIHASVYGNGSFDGFGVLGLVVWIAGFVVETVADRQLGTFLADPKNKGKLMTQGLWRYSRHPNYFGEVLLWWGIGIIVVPLPFGILGLVSPLVLTYLILNVSGVPLAERQLSKHPDLAAYARTTSVFIPLPKKRSV